MQKSLVSGMVASNRAVKIARIICADQTLHEKRQEKIIVCKDITKTNNEFYKIQSRKVYSAIKQHRKKQH